MKFTKRNDGRSELEKEWDEAIEVLRSIPWVSDVNGGKDKNIYNDQLSRIERLNGLIEENGKQRISTDTLLVVAGNLLGIILILSFEKVNVVTSKALGFVLRGRA